MLNDAQNSESNNPIVSETFSPPTYKTSKNKLKIIFIPVLIAVGIISICFLFPEDSSRPAYFNLILSLLLLAVLAINILKIKPRLIIFLISLLLSISFVVVEQTIVYLYLLSEMSIQYSALRIFQLYLLEQSHTWVWLISFFIAFYFMNTLYLNSHEFSITAYKLIKYFIVSLPIIFVFALPFGFFASLFLFAIIGLLIPVMLYFLYLPLPFLLASLLTNNTNLRRRILLTIVLFFPCVILASLFITLTHPEAQLENLADDQDRQLLVDKVKKEYIPLRVNYFPRYAKRPAQLYIAAPVVDAGKYYTEYIYCSTSDPIRISQSTDKKFNSEEEITFKNFANDYKRFDITVIHTPAIFYIYRQSYANNSHFYYLLWYISGRALLISADSRCVIPSNLQPTDDERNQVMQEELIKMAESVK